MRKVCRDYAEIFDEIEENPSCIIQWNLSDQRVLSKPQFVTIDRRNCVYVDGAKSEKSVKLSVVQNCSGDELHSPSTGRTAEEHVDSAVESLQQRDTDNVCQTTALPSTLIDQQGNELQQDMCSVSDHQNCEDVSAGSDNHNLVAVIVTEALSENSQSETNTVLPGNTSVTVVG